MNTAILLYDGFTALDAIGPYEVLSRLPGARVTFVAAEAGPVRTDNGMLTLIAERSFADVPAPELVLVPGGPGEVAARAGGPALDWLRAAHASSTWTTSVCTGSLILAAAGLLAGKRATGHWLAMDKLGELGAEPVSERFVFDGKLVTAAGVSAGIDMALALAAKIAGEQVAQAIQLGIEYDPQPPFDAGSPAKAPAEIVALLRSRSRFVTGEDARSAGTCRAGLAEARVSAR
jgi:putative intracellular protease/amidase